MSPAVRILVALLAGLTVGIASARVPALAPLPALVAPVGQLWLRALQMTIVPLVVALLVTGICSAAPSGTLGRLGVRLVALFTGMLLAAGTLAALLVPPLLHLLRVPTAASGGVASAAPAAPSVPPGAGTPGGTPAWIDAILPLNPIRAAAEGTMLPLVVFVLLFALALTRVVPESREAVVRFFRGVSEAMLVLVHWVLRLAPIGVFAIAVPLVEKLGAGAAGAVAAYAALTTGLLTLVTLLLYPVGARAAGVSLRAFARAMLPALTIAATTRSSVATLPAMLGTAKALGCPDASAGFALPLAVTLFRVTTPPAVMTTVLFAARFHGVAIDVGTMALLVLASVALSAGVVGVPGQASYFVTRLPLFTIAGIPLDLLGPLLAVDLVPDTMRTIGNVTGDVTVTALVDAPAPVAREAPAVADPGIALPDGAWAPDAPERTARR